MFLTVVAFIAYTLTYFVFSQVKMKKMRSHITDLKEQNAYLSHHSKRKSQHEREMA